MIELSKYKHIIWDWNGTLLDDVWLCVDVMNGLLQKRGMRLITVEEYREIFTFPVIDYYKKLGFNFAIESFEKVGTEFIVEYEKRRLESQLQPYTLEVLDKIKRLHITQSVLSAYKQETLDELLTHFGLVEYFDFILGLDNHYADSKLENGKKLIQLLALKPKEVLFIG
ncbi:MAG: HAD hydrolase-like protein, partial [Ignavibacteria bacterium]|nr:HAD hydrolase-like protein [Ignavibacteria bacterium]